LCLAARAGGEVRAFAAQGAFSIGIDLAPTPANRYVVYGDFHELQWRDRTVDVVYCNSIDHAYDLSKLLSEVRRVLVPGGMFVAEIASGSAEGIEAGPWEAIWWDRAGDLAGHIEKSGFRNLSAREFDDPWSGLHVRFAVD
jgi:ubiquinone/menaquinone biosynthesis C-methylase UbiE